MSLNAKRFFNANHQRSLLRAADGEGSIRFFMKLSRARLARTEAETAASKAKWAHRRMRRYAEKIGLAYWPGLLQIEKSPDAVRPVSDPVVDRAALRRRYICDPAALVAAEAVLHRMGKKWTGKGTGGWDSAGVWGLNGQYVAAMWFAAGCEDNSKFRIQVAAAAKMPRLDDAHEYRVFAQKGDTNGQSRLPARSRPHEYRVFAQKGDTLPWLRNYYNGLLWLSRNNIRLPLCRKAIAVLGRLSAPARRAALKPFFGKENHASFQGHYEEASNRYHHFRIRVRDMDWASVRVVQAQLMSGNSRAKAALVGNRAAAKLLGVAYAEGDKDNQPLIAAALSPSFPSVPLTIARRLALGESPVQIASGALSRAEAHEWLCGGAQQTVEELLSARVTREFGREIKLRSVKILRWLETVAGCVSRRESLTRIRTAQAPGGQRREFCALDVLDEFQDADILTGKDSVSTVLERAAQRLGDNWMSEQMKDFRVLAPVPAWAHKLPRGVRLLNTPAALATEGKEMSHCVGGYRDAVSNGQSHILAIDCGHGRRSTVELSPAMAVLQHKAASNRSPARRNQQLLQAFLNRLKRSSR